MTVDEIIKAAGGGGAIARAIKLHRSTPNTWRKRGIPEEHWPAMMRLVPRLTVKAIHSANNEVRKVKA